MNSYHELVSENCYLYNKFLFWLYSNNGRLVLYSRIFFFTIKVANNGHSCTNIFILLCNFFFNHAISLQTVFLNNNFYFFFLICATFCDPIKKSLTEIRISLHFYVSK